VFREDKPVIDDSVTTDEAFSREHMSAPSGIPRCPCHPGFGEFVRLSLRLKTCLCLDQVLEMIGHIDVQIDVVIGSFSGQVVGPGCGVGFPAILPARVAGHQAGFLHDLGGRWYDRPESSTDDRPAAAPAVRQSGYVAGTH